MSDELATYFARQAHRHGLTPLSVGEAGEAELRAFCALVLRELAARGLLPAENEVGCHATLRPGGN